MQKEKLRVLQVLSGLGMGGKEMFVMNFYENIDRNKVQFDFLTFNKDANFFTQRIKELGGCVYVIDINEKSKIKGFILRMKHVYKFFKKNKYEIIHCHGCSFYDILSISIPAKFSQIPNVISHAHNPGTPKNTFIDNFIRYNLKILVKLTCSSFFSCSDLAADSKYPKNIINNEVIYIRNAIDISKFRFNNCVRKSIRSKYNIKSNTIVLGTIGRLEEQKNQQFLIEIFEQYKKLNNDSKLMIVGDGSLMPLLKDIVNKFSLTDDVIFTGKVNNPSDYYQSMDYFLLPSLYEGLPFVSIEAQSSGLTCFLSDKITKQACILDNCYYLSINNSPSFWANFIYDKNPNIDRDSSYYDIKEKGFDIASEADRLLHFYLEML